jgi:hypothetical protein
MKRVDNRDFTIESVESKLGIKLTYPQQIVEGSLDDEKYTELVNFGCSDIWDREGHWLHRDCFNGRREGVCDKCNYYPIVKKYREENGISGNGEPDFIKAVEIMKIAGELNLNSGEDKKLISKWKKQLKNLKKNLGI